MSDRGADVCSSELGRHRPAHGAVGGSSTLIHVRVIFPFGPSASANAVNGIRQRCAGVANQCFQKGVSRLSSCAMVRSGYARSEEHTSELQSLMRTSYAVFCLKTHNYL